MRCADHAALFLLSINCRYRGMAINLTSRRFSQDISGVLPAEVNLSRPSCSTNSRCIIMGPSDGMIDALLAGQPGARFGKTAPIAVMSSGKIIAHRVGRAGIVDRG